MKKNDPGLEAVRAVRETISREFANDPARLIAHYTEMQSQHAGSPVIEGPGHSPTFRPGESVASTKPLITDK
jgi:hypothetical protein